MDEQIGRFHQVFTSDFENEDKDLVLDEKRVNVINIYHHPFESLPEKIFTSSNLRKLCVRQGKLKAFNEKGQLLANLQHLDLEENLLTGAIVSYHIDHLFTLFLCVYVYR